MGAADPALPGGSLADALGAGHPSLFPLQHFAEFDAPACQSLPSFRASRERHDRVLRANETVDCLNLLHGSAGGPACTKPSAEQKSALKHVWRSTVAAAEDASLTPFGAARELLQLGRA